MRWPPTIILTSALIFVISLYYLLTSSNLDVETEAEEKYQNSENLKNDNSITSNKLLKESKKSQIQKKNEVMERILSLVKLKSEVCQRKLTVFKKYSDYMLETSDAYQSHKALISFFLEVKEQLEFTGGVLLQKSSMVFDEMHSSIEGLRRQEILRVGELHVGCNDKDTVGIAILTAAEKINKKKWNPEAFVKIICDISLDQLRFSSYTSLAFTVGMISNLNTFSIFTEFETYDLNMLRLEIIKLKRQFEQDLSLAKNQKEATEVLINSKRDRDRLSQMLLDFIGEIKVRL